MGKGTGVHLWFDEFDEVAAAGQLRKAAEALAVADLQPGTAALGPRFRRLVIEDRDPMNVVSTIDLNTDDVGKVSAAIGTRLDSRRAYTLQSRYGFKSWQHEARSLTDDFRPLQVLAYGPEFGLSRLYWQHEGFLQFEFSNVNSLGVPLELILGPPLRVFGSDHRKMMEVVGALAGNQQVIHRLAIQMIGALDPRRLMVCTDGEIHPLTTHGLYHRQVSGFMRDALEIIRLHRMGGLYAYDGPTDHLKGQTAADLYGYLRYERGSIDAFVGKIDALVENVSFASLRMHEISEPVIRGILQDAEDSRAVPVGRSYYLRAGDGIFGYAESALLALIRAITTAEGGEQPTR